MRIFPQQVGRTQHGRCSDGEHVAVTVRLTDGSELTALVYVAHNLGSIVKDGFVVSESIDDLIAMLRPDADDPDVQWRDIR